MANISINGIVIDGDLIGGNVIVSSGRVIVNGKDVTPDSKEITINVEGDINTLKADLCGKISVTGNVGSVNSQSGDIEVSGSVSGSVSTMSGDVDCGKVGGSVSTMSGKVRTRKS